MKYSLLLVLVSIILSAHADPIESKHMISISTGFGIPLKQYPDYLKLGPCVKLSYDYQFYKNFTLLTVFNSNIFKLSSRPEYPTTESEYWNDPNLSCNLKGNPISFYSLQLGIGYSMPINKFSFKLIASGGGMSGLYPSTRLDNYYNDLLFYQQFKSSTNVISLCYNFGININYKLSDKFCLKINSDYCGTSFKIKDFETTHIFYNNASETLIYKQKDSFTEKVRIFNTSLGIGYMF